MAGYDFAMPKLSDTELAAALKDLPDWSVEQSQLTKTFEFESYMDGVDFARQCATYAETADHHPDLLITWRKVKVSLSTHSEGGISEKDVASAKVYDTYN